MKDYTLAEKVAVAWAVRNRARARQARPATDESRSIARVVLEAQQSTDPTGGAYAFIEPDQINRLHLDGAPGYKHDADGIRAQWRADHQRRYGTVGHIELWGRA